MVHGDPGEPRRRPGRADRAVGRFEPPPGEDTAPPGLKEKARANLAALRTLRAAHDRGGDGFTPAEQQLLARWSGWGALAPVFDDRREDWTPERAELRVLLDERQWRAASRSTLNAHYTSATVVDAVWATLTALGFETGRVLEPGCGAGGFIGRCPLPGVEMVGVEVEPVTAAIARALYPDAEVRTEGFESTQFAESSFDAAVGNVPFGDYWLHDPRHNARRHSIHNHFLIKSLHAVHPGGLVAMVTSRYTLDALNPAARREMADLADLVAAVRLPSGAFSAVAGTPVVTDLLVLRRREAGVEAKHDRPWLRSVDAGLGSGTGTGVLRINEYFAARPDAVLGSLRVAGGMYGRDDLRVEPGDDWREALARHLSDAASVAVARGLGFGAARPLEQHLDVAVAASGPLAPDRGFVLTPGGRFGRSVGGRVEPYTVRPKRDAAELRALIELRDRTLALLHEEASSPVDTPELETRREELRHSYERYVRRHGPLNRTIERPGPVNADTGEPTTVRRYPTMGGFRNDPDAFAVLALEDYDADTSRATPAPILARRVISPRLEPLGADTPDEALTICLNEHGHVDPRRIADLLGVEETDAIAGLGDAVYVDPATGRWETAERYLAGNVRAKLTAVRRAAERDPALARNVAALEAVQPVDLGPDEIDASLGAAWIEPGDVEAFTAELLDTQGNLAVERSAITGSWVVDVDPWCRGSVKASAEWGTGRVDAYRLIEWGLTQHTPVIYDTNEDGSRVRNLEATAAAIDKLARIRERFTTWLWEDPQRTDRLVARFNETFNSTVVPAWDGSRLDVTGLAAGFELRPHQRDAIWRILHSGSDQLLGHVVGAGKTAVMVCAGMEMRRLGIANKPAYVVPDHLLEPFTREHLRLFPAARVLAATPDQTTAKLRREFVARIATGDWDAIVISHSAFSRLGVSPHTHLAYLDARLEELRAAHDDAYDTARSPRTIKQLEKLLVREQARREELLGRVKGDHGGVWFENTGIDFLFVDEAHVAKNLHVPTHIQGLATSRASGRAEDLRMKLDWLHQRHDRQVALFATGTPVTNSLAELYVMGLFLDPEGLRTAGVEHFDTWAATFAEAVTALELDPSSGSYRTKTRFARFRNVPELLTMYRSFADVRTAGDIALPRPQLQTGARQITSVPASDALRDYIASLVARAERVRGRQVHPTEDNMLKICGDGRLASLEPSLVGAAPDPTGGKISTCAARVAAIWRSTADQSYPDPATGETSTRLGACQLVFCDIATPSGNKTINAYDLLTRRLVAHGVPRAEIAYIHDARTPDAKQRLFDDVNNARIRVLVASTAKAGVGTNVQRRLVALHHLDAPWRPADVEQREGRILRQGNLNAEVAIHTYVTEGSFDTYMWQTLERKAAFVAQLLGARATERTVTDIDDDTTLSFAEIKAIATGNPAIVEKAQVDTEVARLRRLQSAHRHEQAALRRTADSAQHAADAHRRRAHAMHATIAATQDTHGDRFAIVLGDERLAERRAAGQHLKVAAAQAHSDARHAASVEGQGRAVPIGRFAGFPLVVRGSAGDTDNLAIELDALHRLEVRLTTHELGEADPVGLIRRLEHQLHSLPARAEDTARKAEHAEAEARHARERIGLPFTEEATLHDLTKRQTELTAELALLESPELQPDPPDIAEPASSREDRDQRLADDRRQQPEVALSRNEALEAEQQRIDSSANLASAVPCPAPATTIPNELSDDIVADRLEDARLQRHQVMPDLNEGLSL